jgi:hypothetical protein
MTPALSLRADGVVLFIVLQTEWKTFMLRRSFAFHLAPAMLALLGDIR